MQAVKLIFAFLCLHINPYVDSSTIKLTNERVCNVLRKSLFPSPLWTMRVLQQLPKPKSYEIIWNKQYNWYTELRKCAEDYHKLCVDLCKVHTFGRRSTGGQILPFLGVNIVNVRSFTEARYTIIATYNIHLAPYKSGSVTCNLRAFTGQLKQIEKKKTPKQLTTVKNLP